MKHVWIFNGSNAQFPSAVFSTWELADAWIQRHGLSGTLTQYPLDVSASDWAIEQGFFRQAKPEHSAPKFVQSFTSASQPHFHYTDGRSDA